MFIPYVTEYYCTCRSSGCGYSMAEAAAAEAEATEGNIGEDCRCSRMARRADPRCHC